MTETNTAKGNMEEVNQKTIEMLRTRLSTYESQMDLMRELINEIPGVIVEARLDAKAGKETKYDYKRAAKACKLPMV